MLFYHINNVSVGKLQLILLDLVLHQAKLILHAFDILSCVLLIFFLHNAEPLQVSIEGCLELGKAVSAVAAILGVRRTALTD